jgi:predicted helicase
MDKYLWTQHADFKMRYYRLSKQKVLGVIRRPERTEQGVVADTIAVMQPVSPKTAEGKKVWKQEIWVMYQIKSKNEKLKSKMTTQNEKLSQLKNTLSRERQIRIISAWRYPGMSPKNQPLPEAVLREIEEAVRR